MTSSILPALFAIIKIGINPVLVNIGPLSVHWYGVMYAIAFAVGYRFGVVPYLEPRGVPRARIESMTAWTILFGLIGARLYFDAQSGWFTYLTHPWNILAFWQGGMAFFGAIFASIITIAVLSRRHKISMWLLFDAGALFATMGQPIGRIGNFINGDILGPASKLPFATAYTNPHAILQTGFNLCVPGDCTAYLPAEIFEAIGTLCILGVLLVLKSRKVKPGIIGITYTALYPVSQIIVFFWRTNMPTWFDLKQTQWTSLAVLVLVLPPMIWLWRRTRGGSDTEGAEPVVASSKSTPTKDEGAAVSASTTPKGAAS